MRKYAVIVLAIVGAAALALAPGLITGALAQETTTTEAVTTTEAPTTVTGTGTTESSTTTTSLEFTGTHQPFDTDNTPPPTPGTSVMISIDGPPTTVNLGVSNLTG